MFYERDPNDVAQNPEAGRAVFEAAQKEFGAKNVRHDKRSEPGGLPDFPVQTRDGRIVSSISISETLRTLPVVASVQQLMELVTASGSFDWLNAEEEDIYSIEDGEAAQ
ncbi:MAG: hypothetical protein HYS70_06380 [Nitrospinae bacterium]|nr:hypothetical protein [Nitrospinota bacterium]